VRIHMYLGIFQPQVMPEVTSWFPVNGRSPLGDLPYVGQERCSLSCLAASADKLKLLSHRITVNAGWKGPWEVSSAISCSQWGQLWGLDSGI